MTSDLEPIERLGRWNGESFVGMERGTLPPSHAYVLVHGWAPGWGRAVLEDSRLRAWEARDRTGRPCRAPGDDGVFCDYPDRALAQRHCD